MISKYEHTQKGGVLFYTCLTSTLVMVVVFLAILCRILISEDTSYENTIAYWIVFLLSTLIPVFIWSSAMFYSLTVRIDHGSIQIVFGLWAFRKKYPLNQIRSCQTVRSGWMDNWGIRIYKNGWLYNIDGLDAVEIELDSGKIIAIGTDEPDELAEAIREAVGQMAKTAV
ncbi:MAG: PH domain-containing protein, partial [Planctomycetota bacterium]